MELEEMNERGRDAFRRMDEASRGIEFARMFDNLDIARDAQRAGVEANVEAAELVRAGATFVREDYPDDWEEIEAVMLSEWPEGQTADEIIAEMTKEEEVA